MSAGDASVKLLADLETVLRARPGSPAEAAQQVTQRLLAYHRDLLVDRIVDRGGWVVQSGPFAGMKLAAAVALLSPHMLVGCFESELHEVIKSLPQRGYRQVINVGCANGFYAVGLARLLPEAVVHAFDIDPRACALTQQAAQLNGVTTRVRVEAVDAAARLPELAGPGTLLLCDIEGAELDLLDPARTPALAATDLLVECHDFSHPQASRILAERFRPTHEVAVIANHLADPGQIAMLRGFHPLQKFLAVWESRPGPTPWAWMTARAGYCVFNL